MADFRIEDHGSVCLIRPLTDAAREWLEENCRPEPWQWLGGAMATEPRLVFGITDGITADGLSVEVC
jgi:hypothetical protein